MLRMCVCVLLLGGGEEMNIGHTKVVFSDVVR